MPPPRRRRQFLDLVQVLLLFATPRRWLRDGQTIKVERAPTAFGEVSVIVQSRLSRGEVLAEVSAPQRQTPEKTFLRIRLPEDWQIRSAAANGEQLTPDKDGTVDISRLRGKFTVSFVVSRK